jgi:F0F1-type ATP synthase epsilon subunit
VLRLRSVRSIVIAPANTGSERSSKIAVIKTAQGNKGIRSINIPSVRKLRIVVIKFTAPSKEETPAKCRLKIVKSTEAPP